MRTGFVWVMVVWVVFAGVPLGPFVPEHTDSHGAICCCAPVGRVASGCTCTGSCCDHPVNFADAFAAAATPSDVPARSSLATGCSHDDARAVAGSATLALGPLPGGLAVLPASGRPAPEALLPRRHTSRAPDAIDPPPRPRRS